MFGVATYHEPAAFLEHAGDWLLRREDYHNLCLTLAHARADSGRAEDGTMWAVVEREGRVLGCALRLPPYKALLTDVPAGALPLLTRSFANRFEQLPAVCGPVEAAERVFHLPTQLADLAEPMKELLAEVFREQIYHEGAFIRGIYFTGACDAHDPEPDIGFVDMPESLRPKYQYFTQADDAKLRAAGYGAAFTSLEDGVQDYVDTHLAPTWELHPDNPANR